MENRKYFAFLESNRCCNRYHRLPVDSAILDVTTEVGNLVEAPVSVSPPPDENRSTAMGSCKSTFSPKLWNELMF